MPLVSEVVLTPLCDDIRAIVETEIRGFVSDLNQTLNKTVRPLIRAVGANQIYITVDPKVTVTFE